MTIKLQNRLAELTSTPRVGSIRVKLVEKIWVTLLIIAIIGVPASVLRAYTTGWLHIYSLHVALGFLVIGVFMVRKRFSYIVSAAFLLGMFYAVGVIGLFTWGLLGAGIWWLVVSTLLAGTLYTRNIGLICMAITTLLIALAAIGFVSGMLRTPADANDYATAVAPWVSVFVATTLMPLMIFEAIVTYQKSTRALLKEVAQQREEIKRLALHDQLTGLPSLAIAEDRLDIALSAAKRHDGKAALMFIDLDEFKKINDKHGHEAGDFVLKVIAGRFKQALRHEDTAARVGGDEFIMIISRVDEHSDLGRIASRVIESVAKPIAYFEGQLQIGCSIGIALFPDHAISAKSLRRVADKAMYKVKKTGKNNYQFASAEDSVVDFATPNSAAS